MKKTLIPIILVMVLAVMPLYSVMASPTASPMASSMALPLASFKIPTFKIMSVVQDTSVTIKTYNFPAHMVFTVRMGAYGTLGINGTVVTTTDSENGGTFTITYAIPAGLKGSSKIAIRLENKTTGYFSYNWFFNSSTGVSPTTTPVGPTPTPSPTAIPGYSGFPTFSIVSVVKDATVVIKTNNLTPNKTFTVRMGKMHTRAIGGIVVATTNSGSGGTQTLTYTIPSALKGLSQISIRMDEPSVGYFAYNWFYNNTTP